MPEAERSGSDPGGGRALAAVKLPSTAFEKVERARDLAIAVSVLAERYIRYGRVVPGGRLKIPEAFVAVSQLGSAGSRLVVIDDPALMYAVPTIFDVVAVKHIGFSDTIALVSAKLLELYSAAARASDEGMDIGTAIEEVRAVARERRVKLEIGVVLHVPLQMIRMGRTDERGLGLLSHRHIHNIRRIYRRSEPELDPHPIHAVLAVGEERNIIIKYAAALGCTANAAIDRLSHEAIEAISKFISGRAGRVERILASHLQLLALESI